MGGLGSLGGVIGGLIVRPLLGYVGCKRMMISLAIPLFVSWVLIINAESTIPLYLTRLFCGVIGAGADSGAIMFVAEISDDRLVMPFLPIWRENIVEVVFCSIRGALSSSAVLVRSIGYMTALIIGAYVDYAIVPYINIGLPVLFAILFVCLPNTPQFLIRQRKYEASSDGWWLLQILFYVNFNFQEAKKSIEYYRGYNAKSIEGHRAIADEFDRLVGNHNYMQQTNQNSFSCRVLCRPLVLKALMIGVVLTFINQYSPCYTLILYGVMIFQQAGTQIDAHESTIMLGILQVLGTFSSTTLVDFIGRKSLLIISTAGCALGLSTMSIYMYLHSIGFDLDVFHWIPLVSLGFVVFISSVGIVPLIFVCIVEMLPPDVSISMKSTRRMNSFIYSSSIHFAQARSSGIALCVVTINMFAFISTKTFPILSESMQLHGCIGMYAIICALATLFITIAIDETKGKNLDSIGKEDEKTINDTRVWWRWDDDTSAHANQLTSNFIIILVGCHSHCNASAKHFDRIYKPSFRDEWQQSSVFH